VGEVGEKQDLKDSHSKKPRVGGGTNSPYETKGGVLRQLRHSELQWKEEERERSQIVGQDQAKISDHPTNCSRKKKSTLGFQIRKRIQTETKGKEVERNEAGSEFTSGEKATEGKIR